MIQDPHHVTTGLGGVPISSINKILNDSLKAETFENETRKPLFDEIETLAEPFVTQWRSWIKTGQYYAKFYCCASNHHKF